jgi:hypothetical protein
MELERGCRERLQPATGQQVAGPGHVDEVVALVHARRLHDERGVPKARVADQVAEPNLADPPAADVLVAIVVRPGLGLRVVEVDEDQPPEPHAPLEGLEESVDRPRLVEPDAGAPGVGRVEAEPEAMIRDAELRSRVRDPGQLRDRRADRPAATGRVLEDDHRRVRAVVDGLECAPAPWRSGGSRPRRTCRDASRCGR